MAVPIKSSAFPTVAKYLDYWPAPKKKILNTVRECIKKAAPKGEEVISYAMPAVLFDGKRVWYAGWDKHYSIYVPQVMDQYQQELKKYTTSKSAINFPWDEPVPVALITKITKSVMALPGKAAKSKAKSAKDPKNKRLCKNGHIFYKTSDCPVCPHCEQEKLIDKPFFVQLGAPARRALENAGITTAKKLATFTKKTVLAFHGMGPSSMPKLEAALRKEKLAFKAGKTEKYTQYHKDGSTWAKGYTLDGVPEGFWEWYRKDGTKLRSGYFTQGKQTGEWTTYDLKGKPYKVTTI